MSLRISSRRSRRRRRRRRSMSHEDKLAVFKSVGASGYPLSREREREREMEMKEAYTAIFLVTTLLQLSIQSNAAVVEADQQIVDKVVPTPQPWPEQFHALLYMNLSTGHLQISNLWYDWPNHRNVNIFQKQLGVLLYDVEWNNGTTFYYTLGENGTCMIMQFDVGILRPDFLDGAEYLGTQATDGFLCNVWEKVDFIWYYEDVLTKRPVRWDFYDGISTHVITFEVGELVQDSLTQAPAYCFSQDKEQLRDDNVVE